MPPAAHEPAVAQEIDATHAEPPRAAVPGTSIAVPQLPVAARAPAVITAAAPRAAGGSHQCLTRMRRTVLLPRLAVQQGLEPRGIVERPDHREAEAIVRDQLPRDA